MWNIVKYEFTRIAKEISEWSTKDAAWFSLVAYNNMWVDRGKLKEEMLNKNELGLNDFENSQPVQMAEDAMSAKSMVSRNNWVCDHTTFCI